MTTVSFQQGVNGFTGTVDTHLKEASPTSSFANTSSLVTDGGIDPRVQALLTFKGMFGSGSNQIPLGATITSATLTLETVDASTSGGTFHRMLTDWTSLSSWTWNSLGAGIQFDDIEARATADLTTGKAVLGRRDFDVTSSVQAWAAGEPNYGWAIKNTTSDGWDFYSAQGTFKPLLTVNYTVDPPPPVAGFSVVGANGSVTEGGAADSFTMALTSAPTADVVVTVSGNADLAAAPTTLTFTSANWSTPQTVTVSAVDDELVEGTETRNLTFSVSSADPGYNNFAVAPVSETVTDNDTPPPPAGFTVVQASGAVTEGGATDSFTMALTSAPTQDVVVTVNGNADLAATPTTLTFTPTNWSTAQAVTVSAVDDQLVEGTETRNVTFSVSSADTRYDNFAVAPVAETVTDNDAPPPPAGFTVVQGNGAVTEGGATDSFTMALASAPTQNVVVTVNGNADLTAAPTTLTFTSANWSTPQTVTVSAVDDQLVEGTETRNVTFSVSSADTRYDQLAVAPVTETVTDNDAPPQTPPPITPQVVRVTDTTQYKAGDPSGYGISDPSGIAYVPGRGLFIGDSEHDESPFRSSTNLWAIGIDGSSIGAYSLRSFTSEPTGLAYNPFNGFLYITDDDKRKVFWVDPANPAVKKGEFSVSGLGITDAEDPKIDPVTGHIYLLDGVSRSLFELTSTGGLVRSFTLPSAITDAEGLAYSAQHDVFFVSSGATRGSIFEIDGDGTLLNTINTLNSSTYFNPAYGSRPYLKGLELAPSSNPNDGDRLSLYAVDYGKDQKPDGRLFELDLGSGWTGGTGSSTLVASSAMSEPTLDSNQISLASVSQTATGASSDETRTLAGDDLGKLAASLLDDGSGVIGEAQQGAGQADIASDLGGHPSAGWDELALVQNMLGEPPSGQALI